MRFITSRERQERRERERRMTSRERVARDHEVKKVAKRYLSDFTNDRNDPGSKTYAGAGEITVWNSGRDGFQISYSGILYTWTPEHGLNASVREDRGREFGYKRNVLYESTSTEAKCIKEIIRTLERYEIPDEEAHERVIGTLREYSKKEDEKEKESQNNEKDHGVHLMDFLF